MKGDFSEKVKITLAKRAGEKCSKCKRGTSSPSTNPKKYINLGEAAHIYGQKPDKNNRYSSSLRIEEISSIDNGIWLCNICHKLIDSDESKYTVTFLKNLKNEHEKLVEEGYFNNLNQNFNDEIESHDKEIFLKSDEILNESELFLLLEFIRKNYYVCKSYVNYDKMIKLQEYHSLIGNYYIIEELNSKWIEFDYCINCLIVDLYSYKDNDTTFINILDSDCIGIKPKEQPILLNRQFNRIINARKIGKETQFKKQLEKDIDNILVAYKNYRLKIKEILKT